MLTQNCRTYGKESKIIKENTRTTYDKKAAVRRHFPRRIFHMLKIALGLGHIHISTSVDSLALMLCAVNRREKSRVNNAISLHEERCRIES